MDFNQLIDQCHSAAKKNGWWDEPRPHEEIILLIKSELFEAMDAYRSDKRANKLELNVVFTGGRSASKKIAFANHFRTHIKDTFEDEIADTAIRIFDYLGFLGLPVKKSVINTAYTGAFMAVLGNLDSHFVHVKHGTTDDTTVFRLVNCLLTLEELAKTYDFDLHTHIQLKLRYNATRGKKHGKEF